MHEQMAELGPNGDEDNENGEGGGTVLTAALAEFNALRQEIMQHIGAQDRLVQLNLTALATIAGLTIAQKATVALLLVVPFLSAALGFAWLHHLRQVALIGRYIHKELWPFIAKSEHVRLPSWEESYSTSIAKPSLVVRVTGSIQPVAVFVAPPLLALIFSWSSATGPALTTMWFTDLVLSAGLILLAMRYEMTEVFTPR
jgi:hypothetical protein